MKLLDNAEQLIKRDKTMSKKNKLINKEKRRVEKQNKPTPDYKSTMDHSFERLLAQAPNRLKKENT